MLACASVTSEHFKKRVLGTLHVRTAIRVGWLSGGVVTVARRKIPGEV